MIIPTTVAEDIQAKSIKSGHPEEFLAGVIISCQITGVETRNLTTFLEESEMINFKKVLEILNNINGDKKEYLQD
ncbi:MAG: hypothetical protein PHH83_02535 [Patescibacteria group bacterium]|nr:hypothetical protein [Patescibacteria group bacterium]